ncbi:MAG: hypothetical protein MZW92_08320 [Comamonadaceae bacterium]|nr:hypothetical protein [Comamonadaceae bacterium]
MFFIWQAAIGAMQSLAHAAIFWACVARGARCALLPCRNRPSGRVHFWAKRHRVAVLPSSPMPIGSCRPGWWRSISPAYALAASVAAGLLRLVQPRFNALYPRFSEPQARSEAAALRSGTTTLPRNGWAVTILPVAVVAAAVYAEDLLVLWDA